MEEKEKIGFSSPGNNNEGTKPGKFKSLNKTPLKKSTSILVGIALFLSTVSIMYFFTPIFSGLLMIFIAVLLLCMTVFAVVITLGIGLIFEEFRNAIAGAWSIVTWLADITNNVEKLNPYFPYFVFPTLAIDSVALILSIIGKAKEGKGYITYIVVMILNIIAITVLTILYYANGQIIVQ